ncbi:MAG: DNA internalization-related competence protein ComEC/Rec2 [Rhodothermales bacterium]|nr:DNA internalization-related competence protein ComEC/Rec2 [Rhodothermales bacterium]
MRPDSTLRWTTYPALLLAGCFGFGIAMAAAAPVPMAGWLSGVAAAAGLAGVAGWYGRRRFVSLAPLATTVAAALAVLCLGGARYAHFYALPTTHLAHLLYANPEGFATIEVRGRIAETPAAGPTGRRFVLAVDTMAATDTMAVSGRVQVTLARWPWRASAPYPALSHGDRVRLRGQLRPLPRRRNPADFDYGRTLWRRRILATLTVRDAASVAVQGTERHGLEVIIVPVREYVRRQLDRHVRGAAGRTVLRALVLGDRSGIEAATRDRLARTGLMHLLAVSGLHVLLVGMVLYGLLCPLLIRLGAAWRTMQISRSVATLAVLTVYVFVAGAGASVVRAVIMAALFIGAAVLQRTAHPLNTLGVAGLVVLAARPTQLFEPGFQLSFAAVAAIVALHPRLAAAVPERWMDVPAARALVSTTLVTVAATLGTMPVLLAHFGRASAAGLVLNLPAIPMTAATLAAGVLVVLTGGWWPAAAGAFGAAADALATLLLHTAAAGDAVLGWAVVHAHVESPWVLAAMAAALLMLAQWPRPRHRWRLGTAALALGTVAVWIGVLGGAHAPGLDVLFLDVGHGDAALLRLPNGRHLLIDAGGRDAATDQGRRTVLPHLARYGIRRLDAVVITHPHADHLGGLPAVLRGVPVGRVLHNGRAHGSALHAEVHHVLDSLGVPHRAVAMGDTLDLAPSVAIHVLAPEKGMVSGDPNEASVVLHIRYGATTFLFMGDAGAEAERRLVARYGALLRSDVVKVGHHGSRTSSTVPFVEHVQPDSTPGPRAVVSVGPHGRFGLPDEDVVARWRSRGARIWTTARDGALWLRSDGQTIEPLHWRR